MNDRGSARSTGTHVRPTVVVVSGLSGAGKSQVLHALEDLGFFCVDNLPTLLAPQAVTLCERGGMALVALGIDVRVRAFLGEFGNVLQQLESGGQRDLHVLFLDASDETLLRRFSESRRPHPLSSEGSEGALAVLDGVRVERERLAPLRASATRIIDTTNTSVHELRRIVIAHFGPASGGVGRMVTRIVSFGFKYGAPVDADIVLDVRFLDNPYFVPELRPMTGLDEPTSRYVLASPETQEFMIRARALLEYVIPKYEREGKSYLTIAIGCTGGRHRSVAIADALARELLPSSATPVAVVHRDVARGQLSTAPPSPALLTDEGAQDERSSVLELKGVSSPPPAPAVREDGPPAEPMARPKASGGRS
ncbi:MAG TPA: RNase adapter RapZ [Polyangiaceae bacterium]|nr:RNase adapter RapZ [Polyangiaceae bacterium]